MTFNNGLSSVFFLLFWLSLYLPSALAGFFLRIYRLLLFQKSPSQRSTVLSPGPTIFCDHSFEVAISIILTPVRPPGPCIIAVLIILLRFRCLNGWLLICCFLRQRTECIATKWLLKRTCYRYATNLVLFRKCHFLIHSVFPSFLF